MKIALPVIATVAALLVAPGASAARRFSPDDLPKIVRLTDPRISPDGRSVALVVSRANLVDNRWDAELTLIDIATRQLRTVTRSRIGVTAPAWSPDGSQIAFLARDAGGLSQIFLLPTGGGDARQLTTSKTSVTLMAWRPDSAGLAFAAADEAPPRQGEARYEDGFEVGNNGYLERSRPQPTHVWEVTTGDGAARRLTSGAWSLPNQLAPAGPPSQLAWTNDQKSVIFVRADTPITGDLRSRRIALVDVATGAVRDFAPSAPTRSDPTRFDPTLSPDGRILAFAAPQGDVPVSQSRVVTVPLAGGAAAEDAVPDLDRNLNLVGWLPDARSLVVAGNDGTRRSLWVKRPGAAVSKLGLGDLNPTAEASVGARGDIVFTATDSSHPAELFYLARPNATPVQLTRLQSATDGVEIGRQETVEWQSDGKRVVGVLTYPPGYVAGTKLPLVLDIHGGPVATSYQSFSPRPQFLAGQGWLVFEPNYRGSDNLGNAFQRAIVGDASAGPGRDIMAGVAMLQQRGIVDDGRIAVGGWSYGGQMTSWLIGAYPGVWKAAIAGAPVTDIVDQYSLSDGNQIRGLQYGSSPFIGDNLQSYAAQSPISLAWKIKAPTLIMSNVGDWRVTTTQAYKLFHALQDNKVPVRFIAYPIPGHNAADPIRARDVARRWVAWFAGHLASGPVAAGPLAATQATSARP